MKKEKSLTRLIFRILILSFLRFSAAHLSKTDTTDVGGLRSSFTRNPKRPEKILFRRRPKKATEGSFQISEISNPNPDDFQAFTVSMLYRNLQKFPSQNFPPGVSLILAISILSRIKNKFQNRDHKKILFLNLFLALPACFRDFKFYIIIT